MPSDEVVLMDLWRNSVLIDGAASSVTAQLCIRLAKSVGLRVIGVVDVQKHGKRLTDLGVGKSPYL